MDGAVSASDWPDLPDPVDPWADWPLFPDFGHHLLVGHLLPAPIMVPVVPGYYDRAPAGRRPAVS